MLPPEGIKTLENFIFIIFFMRFTVASYCKRLKSIQTKKIPWCLGVITLNYADSFFIARCCDPSPFGIIKRITFFNDLFELSFET